MTWVTGVIYQVTGIILINFEVAYQVTWFSPNYTKVHQILQKFHQKFTKFHNFFLQILPKFHQNFKKNQILPKFQTNCQMSSAHIGVR